jgi:hypothetical protein
MPVLGKPATVRSLTVTWFAFLTQIPFTSVLGSVHTLGLDGEAGVSNVPCLPDPAPRSVMPFVVIVRFSRNSPAATRIVSPRPAASIAAWIDSPGRTTPLEALAGATTPREPA